MDIGKLFSVSGRVAVVTGGSSGIGFHIASGLAAAGAGVHICGRDAARAEDAARRIREGTGGACIAHGADIATEEGIEQLVRMVAERERCLHILVNNAGAMAHMPLDTCSMDDWDRLMELNVRAPFFVMQKFLPLLRAGASEDLPATVINIGSAGATKVGPMEIYAYQASKAAVHWLARSLAKRLAGERITANVIAPGVFESRMAVIDSDEVRRVVEAGVPRGRIGSAEDAAGAAIYLASRAGAYVTGAIIPVDGGFSI